MTWQEIRAAFPNRWLVLEALEAHELDEQRIITSAAVIAQFGDDGSAAWNEYHRLHQQDRTREYFPYHTVNEELCIHLQRTSRRIVS